MKYLSGKANGPRSPSEFPSAASVHTKELFALGPTEGWEEVDGEDRLCLSSCIPAPLNGHRQNFKILLYYWFLSF